MEVESMGNGYLEQIQVALGQTVPVGTLIAMLNDQPETGADGT
jgi:pyruvate/2-oxoglutarate dehydrogenase complex dihydrolipoamide acyltransferase (E2) component